MYQSLTHLTAEEVPADQRPPAIAVPLFDEAKQDDPGDALGRLPEPLALLVRQSLERAETSLSKGSVRLLYPPTVELPERLYLVGLGPRKSFGHGQPLREAIGALLKAVDSAGLGHLRIVEGQAREALDGSYERFGAIVGEGISLANFEYRAFKKQSTKDEAKPRAEERSKSDERPESLGVILDEPEAQRALQRALSVGESVSLARELSATPPNVANPEYLTRRCGELAEEHPSLRMKVISAKEALELGMGGLTAVGRAGSTPPALIVLEHRPEGVSTDQPPVMLVGKAVTFDTGGYSIKPSGGMVTMKYDKCGGMTVIGAMDAVARLNLPQRVIGLIPAAENMIDHHAYRPDDILTMYNGKTVEVTNTDAEGRLILADALAWGAQTYKPRAVVDLATLTGGVITALGDQIAGLWCDDEDLLGRAQAAADATGERFWRLPLMDEHREMMKGTHADLTNSAGRKAHPVQGAAFLANFVAKDGDFVKNEPLPWIHFDIAGVAEAESETPLSRKGPTGWGVRLLVRLIEGM